MKLFVRRSMSGCCIFGLMMIFTARSPGDVIPTNAFPGLVFLNPVCITSPPGETNRLFIVEKHGRIIVITNLASPTRTVFMDISSRVKVGNQSESKDAFSEEGLLGLAFHPGYATNHFFYVFYTAKVKRKPAGIQDVVSRFQTSPTKPNAGDPNSEKRLIAQTDRASNHNGGDLHFGPDGYLYASVGDEGKENNAFHNAQHIDLNLFSGILRLDVDKLPGSRAPNPSPTKATTSNYAVPADNPFVGATNFDNLKMNPNKVRTEFWAVGLRNPWRFSFDPATGFLYCGDVGQDHFEEINIITKGGNYGWASFEGNQSPPANISTNGQPVPKNPIPPIFAYAHGSGTNQGEAVVGGVVYHGSNLPQLKGAYVFGDFATGNIWSFVYDGSTATDPQFLFADPFITAFGIDPGNGDILYAKLNNGNNSIIQRIVPAVTLHVVAHNLIVTPPAPVIEKINVSGTNVVISAIAQENLQPQPPQFDYTIKNAFPTVSLDQPLCITSPPQETNRLFILEKSGNIIVITNLAAPTRTVFMNVPVASFGDAGLLGLAFHPGYATNRYFFIFSSRTLSTSQGNGLHECISRFQTTATNANVALLETEVPLITQFDNAQDHNGGDLHFGPDGYLYASVGDEGGQYNLNQNAQVITNKFNSAILRLDVDKRAGNLPPNPHPASSTNYFIPADNPFVGVTNFNGQTFSSINVRTEFFAIGLRNPWRFSIDPITGYIYVGDVGQYLYEEVDIITNGANCGWAYYEGFHLASSLYPGQTTILTNPPTGLNYPVQEIPHSGMTNYTGNCVIGGVVYHGARLPELYGAYVFTDNGSGSVWLLRYDGNNTIPFQYLTTATGGPAAMGIDPGNGDILIAQVNTGEIGRLDYSTNPVVVPSVPVIEVINLSRTNVVVRGAGGPHNGNYFVLTSTNLPASFSDWTRVSTNPFDAGGNFIFTNPVNAASPWLFYRLQLQ